MSEVHSSSNGPGTKTKSRISKELPPLPPEAVPADAGATILIPKIAPKVLEVTIVGVSPLLVCAWSKKAQQQILDDHMKKAKKAKAAKVPEDDYLGGLYVSTEGWTGIPAGGVKGCFVNASRLVDGLPMTIAKRMIFIRSQGVTADGQELVRVHGEHKMHRAMVRINNGASVDVRFRPIYDQWHIDLQIEFLENVVSPEQVLNLLELAGYCEGLCEHRPGAPKNNTGKNGRFEIKRHES